MDLRRLTGPFILRPASELAFSKATGGKDEAEVVNDFETARV